jgi:murein DD-endopeptidase MepM/ murein hydrolase activator NlpD
LNRIFSLLFIFAFGCANNFSYLPQCNFPESILEKGGLVKSDHELNIEKNFIYKKNISCYEGSTKKIISPISYFVEQNRYKKEGILLIEKKFRESKIVIADNKFNNISSENIKRIKRESKILNSKYLINSSNSEISFPLYFPSEGIISSEYGVKRFINNVPRNPHLGLDIASKTGTPIYSAEKGLIILARDFFYRGKNILIAHAYNFKTSYSHLDQILVKEGDFVERGEIIGYMGSSGRVTGPHLHFETIFLGEKLNPIYFLPKD